MKALLTILFLSTLPPSIAILAAETGLTDADLADTVTTDAINMENGVRMNQLSLSLAVTPGTSLIVDVRCDESQDNSEWSQITWCDTNSPSNCHPDVRRYTLADYAGTIKTIASRWSVTKKFVRCTLDDPADGNGTVTVTGARSER